MEKENKETAWPGSDAEIIIFIPYLILILLIDITGSYLVRGAVHWWTWAVPLLWLWALSKVIYSK